MSEELKQCSKCEVCHSELCHGSYAPPLRRQLAAQALEIQELKGLLGEAVKQMKIDQYSWDDDGEPRCRECCVHHPNNHDIGCEIDELISRIQAKLSEKI